MDETAADEATAAATTSDLEPGVGSVTSDVEVISDAAAPTTAVAIDVVASPPATTPQPSAIGDAAVQALAVVLGVEGDIEPREGEHGRGQCIGRLEARGLCVNVPLWGVWQYWDLTAQDALGASDDQALAVAADLFARLGVDPGTVISVGPNGPLPQVTFSSGALVGVTEDGRIASVTAGTDLLPAG